MSRSHLPSYRRQQSRDQKVADRVTVNMSLLIMRFVTVGFGMWLLFYWLMVPANTMSLMFINTYRSY